MAPSPGQLIWSHVQSKGQPHNGSCLKLPHHHTTTLPVLWLRCTLVTSNLQLIYLPHAYSHHIILIASKESQTTRKCEVWSGIASIPRTVPGRPTLASARAGWSLTCLLASYRSLAIWQTVVDGFEVIRGKRIKTNIKFQPFLIRSSSRTHWLNRNMFCSNWQDYRGFPSYRFQYELLPNHNLMVLWVISN